MAFPSPGKNCCVLRANGSNGAQGRRHFWGASAVAATGPHPPCECTEAPGASCLPPLLQGQRDSM